MTVPAVREGRAAVAAYEALRRHVLGKDGHPHRLLFFLQAGMAAWLAGVPSETLPSEPREPCAVAGEGVRPALVRLLADSRLHRKIPYGGIP